MTATRTTTTATAQHRVRGRARIDRQLWRRVLAVWALAALWLAPPATPQENKRTAPKAVALQRGPAPIAFEPNRGQWPGQIRYAGHWGPIAVGFTSDSVVLTLPAGRNGGEVATPAVPGERASLLDRLRERGLPRFQNVVMRFRGANAATSIFALEPLPGKSYHIGSGRTDAPAAPIPRFGRLEYRDVYPGIDVVFYTSDEGRLEYDVVVRPGGDPAVVDFEFEGMEQIRLSDDGDLVLETRGGRLRHRHPHAIADDRPTDPVPSAFRLNGKRLGFTLAEIREMLDARARGVLGTLPITRRKCSEQIKLLEQQRYDIDRALAELRQIYVDMFGIAEAPREAEAGTEGEG